MIRVKTSIVSLFDHTDPPRLSQTLTNPPRLSQTLPDPYRPLQTLTDSHRPSQPDRNPPTHPLSRTHTHLDIIHEHTHTHSDTHTHTHSHTHASKMKTSSSESESTELGKMNFEKKFKMVRWTWRFSPIWAKNSRKFSNTKSQSNIQIVFYLPTQNPRLQFWVFLIPLLKTMGSH